MPVIILLILTGIGHLRAQSGYGDPVSGFDGYPLWYERAALTLTNSVRLAPAEYRDRYLGEFNILLPQNFPPVSPVYWNLDLNRAARDHTVDQASNCGMQHSSCDGTATGTRIRSYYDKGGGWGENIAYSQYRPQGTIRQWLMDADRDGVPAPDGQEPDDRWHSGDGHRANIMSGGYGELGVGFAMGTSEGGNERPFWTQDFGGGDNEYNDFPIAAGSHVYINPDAGWGTDQFAADNVTFMATYYTNPSAPPAAARVIVNGTPYPLTLESGEPGRGTWVLHLAQTGACREYHYEFVSGGVTYRYPQMGILLTFGEGACTGDYATTASIGVSESHNVNGLKFKAAHHENVNKIHLSASRGGFGKLQHLTLHDISGVKIPVQIISESNKSLLLDLRDKTLLKGVYIISLKLKNGDYRQKKLAVR